MRDRRGDDFELGDDVLYPERVREEGAIDHVRLSEGTVHAFVDTGHGTIAHIMGADGFLRRAWPFDVVLSRAGATRG